MVGSSFIKGIGVCDGPRWTVGSDGWTTFNPSPDSRIIYVANAGNDTNDGLSTATPKATLSAAYALLRNGFPDQVLFNRGDTFTNGWSGTTSDGLGGTMANGSFSKSGRSRHEPMLIGAYGNLSLARPKIVPLSAYMAESFFSTIQNSGANLAIQSIEFYCNNHDPNNVAYCGVSFTGTVTAGTATITSISSTTGLMAGQTLAGPGVNGLKINSIDSPTQITMSATTNYSASGVEIRAIVASQGGLSFNGHVGFMYLEDVYLNHCGLGFNQSTPRTDVEFIINRCTIAYLHQPFSGAQGVFMSDFGMMSPNKSIKNYENFYLNNGWHPKVWGADSFSGRNHNAYCHDIHYTHEFVRCITARAPTNGYMQRNGSLSHSNAYLCNAYAGVMGTGIRPNPLNVHDNVILQAADQEQPYLVATAASSVGTTPGTITFTGIPSDTNGNSPHKLNVYNMDNPGSLVAGRNVSSTTSATMTLNGAIAAGTRGNGVQAGDRIVAYNTIANGYSFNQTDGYPIANPPGGPISGTTGYAIGYSGPIYVAPDKPIPSWVSVGYHVIIDHNVGSPTVKFPANTTVSSIDPNRLSFTASAALVGPLVGGNPDPNPLSNGVFGPTLASGGFGPQASAVFFDPTDNYSAAHMPAARWGPNNIVANGESHQANGSCMASAATLLNCDMTGNYFYKHNTTTANNIVDSGQNNTTSPQNLNSNVTVTAYDAATIEGYMTSLGLTATKDAFYAGCLAQRRGAWDPNFTAFNFVNYIRGCFGVAALPTPTYG